MLSIEGSVRVRRQRRQRRVAWEFGNWWQSSELVVKRPVFATNRSVSALLERDGAIGRPQKCSPSTLQVISRGSYRPESLQLDAVRLPRKQIRNLRPFKERARGPRYERSGPTGFAGFPIDISQLLNVRERLQFLRASSSHAVVMHRGGVGRPRSPATERDRHANRCLNREDVRLLSGAVSFPAEIDDPNFVARSSQGFTHSRKCTSAQKGRCRDV